MDHRDMEEPLEVGEDGAFDLGDPSPPPSPAKRATAVSSPTIENPVSTTDTSPPGSPEIQDDWEQVNALPLREEQPLDSQSGTPMDVSDHYKDAVEGTGEVEQTDQPEQVTATSPSPAVAVERTDNASTAEPPGALNGQTSYIAAGLSNVQLPMPFKRWQPPAALEEDSEGEGEFHDAYDTVTGIAKDVGKAREMKEAGNGYYKNGDYEEAVDYYAMALQYCPEDGEYEKERAVYLGNRAACHLQLSEYDDVVDSCTAALELDPRYVKALLRRAQANEHLEKYDLALEDIKALAEIDPSLRVPRESAPRLERLQKEKTEKMTAEAMGKLKELGNSILGHFGMSVDNFKMQQDPDTGSYSVNFER